MTPRVVEGPTLAKSRDALRVPCAAYRGACIRCAIALTPIRGIIRFVGDRELFRTKMTARVASCLVLAVAVGCGRSLKDDQDGGGSSGTSTGGGAGEVGGSSGSSGLGGSAQGGSAEGGSSGSGGSSAQGGSAQGGSTQGGAGGAAGEGGDTASPTRVFLQTGDALFAADPETAETIELCPDAGTQLGFDLIDWVNDRAIVLRRTFTPSSTEIFRVALDGSECTSIYRTEESLQAFSPTAGGRVVASTFINAMSELERPDDGEAAIVVARGLVGIPLDGSPPEVIVPNGVFENPRIVGDRVLFQRIMEDSSFDFFSALSDGSSIVAPIPGTGLKPIGPSRGSRVIVNGSQTGDVYAVDADGGNLATLAMAPEHEVGVAFVGNRVIIARYAGPVDVPQADLLVVDENGGELTPLASSSVEEVFRGSAGDRVIYERAGDFYSVRLDGSDPRTVVETPEIIDLFLASVGDRFVYCSLLETYVTACFNAAADGSDTVTLHESAAGYAGVAGDRVVLYMGPEQYDLVSIPLAGGEPFLLADSPEDDMLVGRIGTRLVIQRGETQNQGEVLSIDADGSRGARLAPLARYVGSISEACGVHRAGFPNPPCAE